MTKLDEHGTIFCFGIDSGNSEIYEELIPPNPVTKFYYRCDRTFHLDQYDMLFQAPSRGFVVLIDGKECLIYQFNGSWKRVKHFDALLIKRQRKGGQSSVRFARLAEESRIHYISHIVDEINKLEGDNWYVFGGEEMKTMLLESAQLKPKIKTDSLYHTFNKDTIKDVYFTQLMNNQHNVNNDEQISKIMTEAVELLDLNPDYLLFTEEEVLSRKEEVEWVLCVDPKTEVEGGYQIRKDHDLYARLKDFQLIAKVYWV